MLAHAEAAPRAVQRAALARATRGTQAVPSGVTPALLVRAQAVRDPARLLFYDVWVARDADGKPLSNTPPYVAHDYSLARLRAGLPFPASCCWNGLVAIDAEPFRLGYRFR